MNAVTTSPQLEGFVLRPPCEHLSRSEHSIGNRFAIEHHVVGATRSADENAVVLHHAHTLNNAYARMKKGATRDTPKAGR
ncbi:MAG: hypothetical protein ACRD3W_29985 [Terriglobales bacterium]